MIDRYINLLIDRGIIWRGEEEPLTFYLYPGEGVLDGMGRNIIVGGKRK